MTQEQAQLMAELDDRYEALQASDKEKALEYYHTLVHQLILHASPNMLKELREAAENAAALGR